MIEIIEIKKDVLYGLNSCPECQGNLISVVERGETVCYQCGLIISEKELALNHSGPRIYTAEQSREKARTGSPTSQLFPDISFCVIHNNNTQNPHLKRAIKLNSYIPWDKKKKLIAIIELKRLSHNLGIPEYIKKATLELYEEAVNRNMIKGRSIKGMIIACLFYVCKIKKIPRTFQEICMESSIAPKKLKKYYLNLVKELNLKTPINNPIANVTRFIANLGLDFDTEKLTIKILEEYFKNSSTGGKNPNGFCGAAIYLASKLRNKRINQKVIANIIGITDTTLRNRYHEIINKINFNNIR